MKQKILTLLVTLLTSIAAWADDFEVDGIYYVITSSTDMTVSVSYRGIFYNSYSDEYSGAVVIPESVTYNGKTYSVTSIGDRAFRDCSGLTSVVIPSSVTSIGNYAFYGCSGLTSVVIPSSVTSIGESAFSGCRFAKDNFVNNSSRVSFSYWGASIYEQETADGLLIDKNVVVYCRRNATSVVIPSSVTSIGNYAFDGCSGLTSVVIPSSVTSIGSAAFYDCYRLTSVVIPSSVTSIGSEAFESCSGLTSVEIPSSVTSIGDRAFRDCSGLTTVNFNAEKCSSMGKVFYGCSSLTEINIGDNVTTIPDYAFRDCSGLTTVNFNAEKCSSMGKVFYGCSSLTEINIGDNVTTIPDYAFCRCSGLTSVAIPSSVTEIGSEAFYGCSGLTSVVIPSSVTSIGSEAFCDVTKAFFLTNTKPSIGSYAFSSCKVYYTANNDSYSIPGTHKVYSLLSSMFEVDGVKYIPTSMSQRTCDMVDVDYSAESVNSAVGPTVKYTNSTGRQYDFKVNNVNMYAAYGCKALSDLNLKNEGEIEKYAFYNSSATAIDVDNTVTTIGDYAFSGCTSATFIDINNEGSLGERAFSGCSGATEIKLGDKITSIGNSCFSGCSSLLNINIPKLITTINTSTFEGCSSMTAVTFNKAVTSIGSDAFRNCSKLASLTIPANVTSISSGAFDGCTSIGDLTFEDCETAISLACVFPSVKNIYMGRNVTYSMSNSSPFSGNNNLENVTTSMYVTNVPDYAFYNCKALKDVYLSDGVRTIGTYVFSGDIALANFEVGISVESIGAEAFSDCTALLEFTSHSILPATVGTEALDDIDKLECTLHVPEGTEDAYAAADQWKEFWIEGDLLPRYNVMATVDPECAGMGTVKGSNVYDKNSTATLEAVPAENYVFVEWSDGNTNNPREITVNANVNLTAVYKEATVTGISNVMSRPAAEGIYDIYGRKLTAPQRGINIINGKKVVVK